jgi:cytochrome c biogenesis factor
MEPTNFTLLMLAVLIAVPGTLIYVLVASLDGNKRCEKIMGALCRGFEFFFRNLVFIITPLYILNIIVAVLFYDQTDFRTWLLIGFIAVAMMEQWQIHSLTKPSERDRPEQFLD